MVKIVSFSKFFNLPELINVFKECADIKTADMLNLPVPEAHFHNVVVKPSDIQKDMVAALSDRAKDIHDKKVQPEEDNMLKVTNDGRKIGLDQRLIDPLLPDDPNSKVNTCVANVFDIYQKNDDKKSTQLVFCDFSTPKNDGSFNLYELVRSAQSTGLTTHAQKHGRRKRGRRQLSIARKEVRNVKSNSYSGKT